MSITKEQILNSVDKPELVYIEALNDEIPLRPLSKTELIQVEKIESKAYGIFETSETAHRKGMRQNKQVNSEVNTKGKVDLAKQSEASFKGKVAAIHLSINNDHVEAENWDKNEIERMPGKVFDEIFEKVQELSGIDITEDDVDQFPEDE